MDSAAKPLEMKYMRGMLANEAMSAGTSAQKLRGVERNTARGVKEAPTMMGITAVEYAPAMDAPPVDPFDTYEDEN
jgi:hypothetical protein